MGFNPIRAKLTLTLVLNQGSLSLKVSPVTMNTNPCSRHGQVYLVEPLGNYRTCSVLMSKSSQVGVRLGVNYPTAKAR